MSLSICVALNTTSSTHHKMGWLRLVSFAKEPYKRDYILRSLLQKSPLKETVFCKQICNFIDPAHISFYKGNCICNSSIPHREVGGWGRDPKKCTERDWGMGSSTIYVFYDISFYKGNCICNSSIPHQCLIQSS